MRVKDESVGRRFRVSASLVLNGFQCDRSFRRCDERLHTHLTRLEQHTALTYLPFLHTENGENSGQGQSNREKERDERERQSVRGCVAVAVYPPSPSSCSSSSSFTTRRPVDDTTSALITPHVGFTFIVITVIVVSSHLISCRAALLHALPLIRCPGDESASSLLICSHASVALFVIPMSAVGCGVQSITTMMCCVRVLSL
jgi:hypothetical protein